MTFRRLLFAVCTVGGLLLLWIARIDTARTSVVVTDMVEVNKGWTDEASCVRCHEQAKSFFQTGHAKTLHRASDPHSLRLLKQLTKQDIPDAEASVVKAKGAAVEVIRHHDGGSQRLQLDWCFGSGTHACTWVATLQDSYGQTDVLEFRQSWFASQRELGLTPGQPLVSGKTAVSSHGLLFDGPKARRCFSCHATSMPVDQGCIVEDQILAGVTCQRCHGPRQQHVVSEGAMHPAGWKAADRMEAVGDVPSAIDFLKNESPTRLWQEIQRSCDFNQWGCFNPIASCVPICGAPHAMILTEP